MTQAMPLLARQLKARRRALGVTQEEMAARLGVDRTTLWRWESGKATPTSGEVIEGIKRIYGCSQEELNLWFAGGMPAVSSQSEYRVSGYDFMAENGWTLEDLVERILEIDAELIPELDPEDIGSSSQWVPLFLESPSTWRILTSGGEIVGYWQYLCLTDEAFQRVKAGALRDGEIGREMIEFPIPFDGRHDYRMYLIMFGVVPAHQNPTSETLLLRNFTGEIARLANEGVFFSEIATVAFTAKSAYLCRELGMRSLGKYRYRRDSEVGEVFHIERQEIANARLARHNKKLIDSYSRRFA